MDALGTAKTGMEGLRRVMADTKTKPQNEEIAVANSRILEAEQHVLHVGRSATTAVSKTILSPYAEVLQKKVLMAREIAAVMFRG